MSDAIITNIETLLDRRSKYQYWQALHRHVECYQEARIEIQSMGFELDRLERQMESEDEFIRNVAGISYDSIFRQRKILSNASDAHELAYLRAEKEHAELRELVKAHCPRLLPLPPFEPVPETSEKQVARGQDFERLLGMLLSERKNKVIQYVTLDQMASICQLGKKTVERWYREGDQIPEPDIEGGGGRPHQWIWENVRDALIKASGKNLPIVYPDFNNFRG